jgi:hypothetical protein
MTAPGETWKVMKGRIAIAVGLLAIGVFTQNAWSADTMTGV